MLVKNHAPVLVGVVKGRELAAGGHGRLARVDVGLGAAGQRDLVEDWILAFHLLLQVVEPHGRSVRNSGYGRVDGCEAVIWPQRIRDWAQTGDVVFPWSISRLAGDVCKSKNVDLREFPKS
jgi:hypothetical protein